MENDAVQFILIGIGLCIYAFEKAMKLVKNGKVKNGKNGTIKISSNPGHNPGPAPGTAQTCLEHIRLLSALETKVGSIQESIKAIWRRLDRNA